MSKKKPRPSKFTDDEREQIITEVLALKKTHIKEFLGRVRLSKSGTKADIKNRIEEAVDDGKVSLSQLVEFLDEVIPWGKQHVVLYKGPRRAIDNWKKAEWVTNLLRQHRVDKYLNSTLPLGLPDKIKLSSISHDRRRLRIVAISKREGWDRDPNYDADDVTDEGQDVQLRAFVRRVTRNVVAFDWDLKANTAFLQISQLPTGVRYQKVQDEFFELIAPWFDANQFAIEDMRPVIKKLDELEAAGNGETRSHGIAYRSREGRTLEGKSPSPADPLLGEAPIDAALNAVRTAGVGHLGNFYWLHNGSSRAARNPLDGEVHLVIVGKDNRVNFPTPNDEATIRYVLSRIRRNCA